MFVLKNWMMYFLVPLVMMAMTFALGVFCCRQCSGVWGDGEDTLSVRVDSIRDTLYVEVHDTMPVISREKVVKYIDVPCFDREDTIGEVVDTMKTMEVVQREYSDDSTYTAYVSGVLVEDWPKLDSIIVRQRTIENTIQKIVTVRAKAKRWNVGIVGGYGIGLINQRPEPFIGFGVSFTFLPQ